MNDLSQGNDAGEIRRRLVGIADELRLLSPDDFHAEHRLNIEADDLREQLEQLTKSDSRTLRDWAERAGRKGSHASDDSAAEASIVSPHEGSGSSWA